MSDDARLQELAPDSLLGAQEARRVLRSLIVVDQERRLHEGRIGREQLLAPVIPAPLDLGAAPDRPVSPMVSDDITIDEERLGYDSLALLDLVSQVGRFFELETSGIEDYLLLRSSLSEWARLVAHHFKLTGARAAIRFKSSGSTDAPSETRHTAGSLTSEIDAILRGPLRDHGPVKRVLCHVEPRHIYGFLWSVLLPRALDCPVLDLPRGLPGPVTRAARAGDLVLSTPSAWERMAESGVTLQPGVIAVSSGAPATETTWKAAQALRPQAFIEIYGATETGGVGWRTAPAAPFRCFDDIEINGASVGGARFGNDGCPLQDHVDIVGQDHFRVRGRRDTVVQVEGLNVNLTEVADLLRSHDQVDDAAVRLDQGRLKAFVVVRSRDGSDEVETELRGLLRDLPSAARPDRFRFGSALPRETSGKLADWT